MAPDLVLASKFDEPWNLHAVMVHASPVPIDETGANHNGAYALVRSREHRIVECNPPGAKWQWLYFS